MSQAVMNELVNMSQEIIKLKDQRRDVLAALKRANTLLAELTHSEWIPKKDALSIDIRQRINASHVIASSAIAKAEGEQQ
jgi:hypothetical protein